MDEFFDQLPPPFVCVVCGRMQEATPWTRRAEFRAPVCNYCSTPWRCRTRTPGMTRGDHRQIMRLAAVAEALAGEAGRIEWEGKYHGGR